MNEAASLLNANSAYNASLTIADDSAQLELAEAELSPVKTAARVKQPVLIGLKREAKGWRPYK